MHTPADCLFCAIVDGGIPADVVWRDDEFLAFRDINPQAPLHVLVIPQLHRADAGELAADPALAGRWIAAAAHVAGLLGAAQGYRLVANTGPDGGQTVDHAHLHVLAGRPMRWPPG
jgi:histidine triad (HIT) family protein